MKPDLSLAWMAVLSKPSANARARSIDSCEVISDGMISTSLSTGTGLKKWMPSTFCGRLVAIPIFMIGIAVANGVLLIEFILHRVEESGGDERVREIAIIEASKLRLRPIMMTSLASILGLVPMALGLGHGAEANIPLGRAVIGGQLLATLLTLFLVPTLFQLFGRRKTETAP